MALKTCDVDLSLSVNTNSFMCTKLANYDGRSITTHDVEITVSKSHKKRTLSLREKNSEKE